MKGMRPVEKVKTVIGNPSYFFDEIKPERGIGEAFKYMAILSLVNLAVGFIQFIFNVPLISGLIGFINQFGIFSSAVYALPAIIYFISLALSFISAGFIHLFAKMLKCKGDYTATYKALTYASTPSLLLGWIPFIGWIFSLYAVYLSLIGFSKLHGVSMRKALAVIVIVPLVIVLIIAGIFAGLLFL